MDPTFQYAGKVRIPPKEFQLRARIESSTRDTTNVKQYKHWQEDVPDFTYNFPKLNNYDQVFDRSIGYTNKKINPYGYDISYNDPSTDRRIDYRTNSTERTDRNDPITDPITGYKKPNYKITSIPYMDMSPTNTRTDKRDYKQSQPFVAGGPDLAYNPYFDRYDPVTDPRNAVRELRSVVYEDKGGSRGEYESQKLLRRNFENRWVCKETIDDDMMDSLMRYEIISQKPLQ
jgi:hypothetical protein